MTNEQKAVKLEEMAANREADSRGLHDLAEKLGLTELQKQKTATIAMADADAALLAGAEALERYEEAKGALRQIASGQSWNPQRDAEEALARLEGK